MHHAVDDLDAVDGTGPAQDELARELSVTRAGDANRPERLAEIGLATHLPAAQANDDDLDLTAAELAVSFAPQQARDWGAAPGRHQVRVHRLTVHKGARVLVQLPDIARPLRSIRTEQTIGGPTDTGSATSTPS